MLSIDVTSWRDVMTWYHLTNTWTLTFREWATRKTVESWTRSSFQWIHNLRNRLNSFCDVMTWRHDVMESYEWKIINLFELSDPQNHVNKKRMNFLALLQAEIGESSLVTSWHDVMTSRNHKNRKLMAFLNSVTWKTMETKKESTF